MINLLRSVEEDEAGMTIDHHEETKGNLTRYVRPTRTEWKQEEFVGISGDGGGGNGGTVVVKKKIKN